MPTPKKYVCGFCGRGFTRSEHKQRHERSHTNEKPFHCLYCTFAFVRRDLLQRHCRTVHNIRLVSRPPSKGEKKTVKELPPVLLKEERDQDSHWPGAGAYSVPAAKGTPSATLLLSGAPRDFHHGPELQQINVSASADPPLPNHDTRLVASAKALLQLAPSNCNAAAPMGPAPPYTPLLPSLGPPPSGDQMVVNHQFSPTTMVNPVITVSVPPLYSADSGQIRSPPAAPPAMSALLSPHAGLELLAAVKQSLHHLPLLRLASNLQKFGNGETRQPDTELFLIGFSVLFSKMSGCAAQIFDSEADLVAFLGSEALSDELKRVAVSMILAVGHYSKNLTAATPNSYFEAAKTYLGLPGANSAVTIENLRALYLSAFVSLTIFGDETVMEMLERGLRLMMDELAATPAAESIFQAHSSLFWSCYVLITRHRAGADSAAIASWFLSKPVSSKSSLMDLVKLCAERRLNGCDKFVHEVVICALTNEALLIESGSSILNFLGEDLNRATLHMHNLLAVESELLLLLFEILKRKLIIDSPSKYKDVLERSVIEISSLAQWQLLFALYRTQNHFFKLNELTSSSRALFQDFGNSLLLHFSSLQKVNKHIDTSMSFVSFPLLFNQSFINLAHEPCSVTHSLDRVDRKNAICLVLHWYTNFVKILVSFLSHESYTSGLHSLTHSLLFRCLLSYLAGKEVTQAAEIDDVLLPIVDELVRVSDSWLQVLDVENKYSMLKENLNRFLKDLAVLAINNENFQSSDVYVTNDSLLLKKRRAKSTGSVELSHCSDLAPVMSNGSSESSSHGAETSPQLAANLSNDNYVLMSRSRQSSTSIAATNLNSLSVHLPPLQHSGFPYIVSPVPPQAMIQAQDGKSGSASSDALLKNSPAVPDKVATMLPPLQTTLRDAERRAYGFK